MNRAILVLIEEFKKSICNGYRDANCCKCLFGRQSADYDWYCRLEDCIELFQWFEDKKERGEINEKGEIINRS